MISSINRLALSFGLTLALGFAFALLGCGRSVGRLGSPGEGRGDAEVPEGVAREIRTCAAKHMLHLGHGQRSVSFDVKLASNGEVDSVALRESTLGDEELEACMASALRSLSDGDLPLRHSGGYPQGRVAPESRGLLGQVQALECLASPPCLLVIAFFIGAAYVAVQIYVHAAQSSTAKPKPRTAPTATTMPTAMAVDDETERCKKVKDKCIEHCADTVLDKGIHEPEFSRCLRACMGQNGC